MPLARLDQLIETVQHNCHVTDARFARGMTLCTYLLEMREFFRWEHGIALGEAPPRSEVGPWLTQREALWETLEGADFEPIPVGDANFDPFDSTAINRALLPAGLIYGAGIGRFHKPHFFLGSLGVAPTLTAFAAPMNSPEAVTGGAFRLGTARRQNHDEILADASGARVLVCGCEYARDLTAIPAALQRDTIVVRQEALRQWLWEKAEAWQLKQQPGAMQSALAAYRYFEQPGIALERMTLAETETLILHEKGEFAAGQSLGADWEEMLASLGKRHAEILLRAVRDNWADCLSTLPQLLAREADASLHFWFSNFEGIRRELFPALAKAYHAWTTDGGKEELASTVAAGASHWGEVAGVLLQRFRNDRDDNTVLQDDLVRLSHDCAPIAL